MQVALAGVGGPPTGAPTCQANPGGFGLDLSTSVNLGFQAQLPAAVNSTSAATPLTGFPTWDFLLSDTSGAPVTNPTITVNSGYSTSVFGGSIPTPGLPTSCGLPGLASGQTMFFPQMQATGIQTTFAPGFDSTRSTSPQVVPVGGGEQTISMTVTLSDSRYAMGNILQINIGSGPNDTVVSTTPPNNLDQGEFLNTNPGHAAWFLNQAVLGKQYTFGAVVRYANPFNYPWTHVPDIMVTAAAFNGDCGPCNVSGPTVTVPVPSLDGGVPGAGSATFAVDETGHQWRGGVGSVYVSHYTQFQDQSITFGPLADKIVGEAPFEVTASGSSGLPVSFTASGPCSVSGSTVSLSGTGVCTITAAQGGSDTFNGAPSVARSFNVLSPAQFAQSVDDAISGMGMPAGISNSLTSKLDRYIASTGRGNQTADCGQLGAFVNYVNAQSGNKISTAAATLLLTDAARLSIASGC
jgi:hypothetical protein